ncbi:tRNA (adenosine(37)-N6)-dimethylallyltransferase MiaA [Arenibacter latericius]|uniref:tRNA (adenosine(37)-N6)-dimethylallyltransferase MiaA n=1 Tax=Arenibacter latericius TaxID=86104 RepID=UPI00040772E7|nr:tRNA (adenosine(37)-N6)-dimethylallyltransferase MiaA [Arenibacter latericius]MDX1363575.1 tRNA (adenosine(37)-N6)-dimethylallyltransferase MiaA [Arenibacter latericius]
MKSTLISVVGPTAIGKTALAIALAKTFKTEIISADSRQFYKEMTIGTAVPSETELAQAPHHFIQHKSIHDTYSVGDFERDALDKLQELFKEKKIVIMAGGSGLYTDAVTQGLDHFPNVNSKIRTQLNEELLNNGISSLQDQLKTLDLEYYNKVDLKNPHRLIRALEICIGSGQPYSSFLNRERTAREFQTVTVGLEADRKILYDRINRRVDLMVEQGLLEEVSPLKIYSAVNALQTVGYKELFRYMNGEMDLKSAIEEIKKNTRRFAKRQLTWLRKKEDILWVDYEYNLDELVQKIEQKINRDEDA